MTHGTQMDKKDNNFRKWGPLTSHNESIIGRCVQKQISPLTTVHLKAGPSYSGSATASLNQHDNLPVSGQFSRDPPVAFRARQGGELRVGGHLVSCSSSRLRARITSLSSRRTDRMIACKISAETEQGSHKSELIEQVSSKLFEKDEVGDIVPPSALISTRR